jgi:hypothetical protein
MPSPKSPTGLTNALWNVKFRNMNIPNLEALRKTSKKMRNLIDRSGILRNKIRNAKNRIRQRTAARLADPLWAYHAANWRRNAVPAMHLGLHPTLAIGAPYMHHPGMGQHIRRYVRRTRFGLLHPVMKQRYNNWAVEHNQGRPYAPNSANKRHVARALLAGFRKRKASRNA